MAQDRAKKRDVIRNKAKSLFSREPNNDSGLNASNHKPLETLETAAEDSGSKLVIADQGVSRRPDPAGPKSASKCGGSSSAQASEKPLPPTPKRQSLAQGEHPDSEPSGLGIRQSSATGAIERSDESSSPKTRAADGNSVAEVSQPEESPEPSQPFSELWLRTKNAPIWNAALKELQSTNPKMFRELERTKHSLEHAEERTTNDFFRLKSKKPEHRAVIQRCKRYLPSLAAIRSVAMTAAAWDPHKIAPIICACIFFSVDLAMNSLSPEDNAKMRNIVFESIIAINEWISFEANFRKKDHDAIREEVKELEGWLDEQYKQTLELLCDILMSRNRGWKKRAGDKITNKVLEYDQRLASLKDHKSLWASKRKAMEETLASEKDLAEVLNWLRAEGDPEKTLAIIQDTVTTDGIYLDCAAWIMQISELKAWSDVWISPSDRQKSPERVIWIHGPYGTGKSTIMFRVVTDLKTLSENFLQQPQDDSAHDQDVSKNEVIQRPLRIIPYFCTAPAGESTKRADFETVFRALGQKLSLLPDFTLDPVAEKLYSKHTRLAQSEISKATWTTFMRNLLIADNGKTDYVFVIDALDECDTADAPEEAEKILQFFQELMRDFDNVQLICSSRSHVPVPNYFHTDMLAIVEALSAPKDEIAEFIHEEIERRRKGPHNDSIFFRDGCEDLCTRLENALIAHAAGMYQWVLVWLQITIPLNNKRDAIGRREGDQGADALVAAVEGSSQSAGDAYDKLKDAYLRLWKLGARRGFDDVRIGLFRIVISAISEMSLNEIILLLRIRVDNNTLEEAVSTSDLESLYSNFLIRTDHDEATHYRYETWSFTHESARQFVLREVLADPMKHASGTNIESEVLKDGHLYLAKRFIEIMRDDDHAFFKEGADGNRHHYIIWNGFRHCRLAATRQSIHDPIWAELALKVLLRPNNALGRCLRGDLGTWYFNEQAPLSACWHEKKSDMLFAHALVWLDILRDDEFSEPALQNLQAPTVESKAFEKILWNFITSISQWNSHRKNAFRLACSMQKPNTVAAILMGSYHVLGRAECLKLLEEFDYTAQAGGRTAFTDLVYNTTWHVLSDEKKEGNISCLEAILRFEKQYLCDTKIQDQLDIQEEHTWVQLWLRTENYQSESIDLVNFSYWRKGMNSLTYAACNFDEDTFCRLYRINPPRDVNVTDKNGNTALFIAAASKRRKIVAMLLDDFHAEVTHQVRALMETWKSDNDSGSQDEGLRAWNIGHWNPLELTVESLKMQIRKM